MWTLKRPLTGYHEKCFGGLWENLVFTWMDYINCASHVWKCPIKSLGWFQIQQWIQRKGWATSRFCNELLVVWDFHGGSIYGVLYWLSLRVVVCWWLSNCSRRSRIIKDPFPVLEAKLESKGLKINNKKTKILISIHKAPSPVDNSKYPGGVCSNGVSKYSIYCNYQKHCINHRCTNLRVLREDPDFNCRRCRVDIDPPQPQFDNIKLSNKFVK